MHYMSYIRPLSAAKTAFVPEKSPGLLRADDESSSPNHIAENPLVILGGYSYGSLILKHLPPVSTILHPFSPAPAGSAADEILLRSRKLADQSSLEWINLAQSHERERTIIKGHEVKLPVIMGGEETNPEVRRSSRDVRRSLDGGRRAGLGSRLRSLSLRRRRDEGLATTPQEAKTSAPLTTPRIRYLLISPLTPPISTLAAPALCHKLWGMGREGNQATVGTHPTLAVYGDKDVFASAKKTRDWSEQLEAVPGSSFSGVEISGAGHFWVEQGVEEQLRAALKEWEGLVG
jgi:pimeloyl-ACP methyl ester carboxylesterase